MTTAIYLHGAAGKFGGPFHLEVRDPAEALLALMKMVKGFRSFLQDGDWRMSKGPERPENDIDASEIQIAFGKVREFHLVPVIAGAKKAGIGKIIAGVVIVAAAVVLSGGTLAAPIGGTLAASGAAVGGIGITYASVALFGASMIFGGISQMLAGSPKATNPSTREDPTQRVNALFNGPVNVGELGQCIPIAYGPKVMCGSVVPSASLVTEKLVA